MCNFLSLLKLIIVTEKQTEPQARRLWERGGAVNLGSLQNVVKNVRTGDKKITKKDLVKCNTN